MGDETYRTTIEFVGGKAMISDLFDFFLSMYGVTELKKERKKKSVFRP